MRGLKGLGPLLLVGIAGLAWVLFLSEPGANWLASLFTPADTRGAAIGRLVFAEGLVRHVLGGDVQKLTSPLNSPIDLHDGDRIETDNGARAVILLNSQDELELKPLSAVTLQLWNEKDAFSALYITVLNGDVESRKSGVRGRAYLVRNGRLYLPSQKASKKPMALTVLRSAPLDMGLSSEKGVDGGADFEPDRSLPADKTPSGFTSEHETLSNDYIDEMIVSRQAQLQKCWLSRIKDKPDKKGQILIQFEISRRGKVKELKVADSSLSDESLQKCVLTVIERITFRSFKGPEISVSYPINFE